MGGLAIRNGREADLPALSAIELASFASDRLSRRSLRRLLSVETARVRVASLSAAPVGYHIVLLRSGSTVARLYSIAVDPAVRGKGSGAVLLDDAEKVARRLGRKTLRLEVRADNRGAIRLYESRGYVRIGTYRQYYADKADALRYEKRLGPGPRARAPAGEGADADKDRSPADFGVLKSRRRRSGRGAAHGYARTFPLAPAPRAPQAGRKA